MGITVLTGYALLRPGEKRPILLWAWFLAGLCSTGAGIAAVLTKHAPPIECLLCGMLLWLKAYRDDRHAKDGMEVVLPQSTWYRI